MESVQQWVTKEGITVMNCPKCGNEMSKGEIGVSAASRGIPALFWAPTEVINKHIPSLLTIKKVVSEGGVHIKLGNGMTKNRNAGYVCKACNCVLIDL